MEAGIKAQVTADKEESERTAAYREQKLALLQTHAEAAQAQAAVAKLQSEVLSLKAQLLRRQLGGAE